MAFDYPVILDLEGRRVVVFGGGPLAVERVERLLEVGAVVTVVTPTLPSELAAAKLEHVARLGAVDDLDGVFLAIATGEDGAPVADLFAVAERQGVLFASIDDVANSHFGAASTIRRGFLQLTISTSGQAPALSKRLRKELEQRIDDAHGELVEVLHRARQQLLPREVPFDRWAAAWGAALDDLDGLLDLVRDGRGREAEQQVVRAVRRAL